MLKRHKPHHNLQDSCYKTSILLMLNDNFQRFQVTELSQGDEWLERKRHCSSVVNRLAEVNLSIMIVFITKEVGTTEHHVTCYLPHKAL